MDLLQKISQIINNVKTRAAERMVQDCVQAPGIKLDRCFTGTVSYH